MAGKRPPEEKDLEFLRHDKTGRVHVEQWLVDEEPDRDVPAPVDGDALLAGFIWFHQRRTLCGQTIPSESAVDEFADEDLCTRCVQILGDYSYLAFEHPLPAGRSEP